MQSAREVSVLVSVSHSRMVISERDQFIEQIRDYNLHLRDVEMYSHLENALGYSDYSIILTNVSRWIELICAESQDAEKDSKQNLGEFPVQPFSEINLRRKYSTQTAYVITKNTWWNEFETGQHERLPLKIRSCLQCFAELAFTETLSLSHFGFYTDESFTADV